MESIPLERLFPLHRTVRLRPAAGDPIQEALGLALSGGSLVVADGTAANLKVFAPDGRHLATHGRRGRGPGEFARPQWLTGDGGDQVFVLDPVQGRVSEFSVRDGFRHSWPLHAMQPAAFSREPGGGFLLGAYLVAPGEVGRMEPGARLVHILDGMGEPVRSFREAEPFRHRGEASIAGVFPIRVGSVVVSADRLSNRLHHRDLRDGREWWTSAGESFYRAPDWASLPGRDAGFSAHTEWPDRQMWAMQPIPLGPDRFLAFFTDWNPELGRRDCRYVLMDLDGNQVAVTERTERVVHLAAGGLLYAMRTHLDGEVDVVTFEVAE